MKMNLSKMLRSGIALLLAVCMVAGYVPAVAFAAENNCVNNVQSAVNQLTGVLDDFAEAKIAEVKAAVEAVQNTVEALNAEVEATIADLYAQVRELNAKVEALNEQLENAVGEAKAAVEAAIAEVKATIAKIEAAIAALENAVAELNNARIALDNALQAMVKNGFNAAVGQVQAAIDGIAQAVENMAGAVSAELAAKLDEAVEAAKAQLNAVYYNATTGEYTITEESYLVALGDNTTVGKGYVNLLAAELQEIAGADYGFKNLAKKGMMVQDIFEVLTKNASEIAKADLITVGFGNNGFTNFAVENMMSLVFEETVEFDWLALVGEEGLAYVEDAKAEIHETLIESGIEGEVMGLNILEAMEVAIESYAYSYVSYVVNLPKAIEAIQEISPDALVVIVGMYNPLQGVALDLNGEKLDLGEYLQKLVDATNVTALALAMLTGDAIYVDAPAVETNNNKTEMAATQFITEFLYYQGANLNPNENGHEYIKDQILNALTVQKEEEKVEPAYKLGDADGNGVVNTIDAMLVMQYFAKLITADKLTVPACDVDGNGVVNTIDAMLIMQYFAKLITKFPVEA